MTHAELSQARNPKLRGSLAAMRRAADMARRVAVKTNTGIVVVREGKSELISAAQLVEIKF